MDRRCPICATRPGTNGNPNGYCRPCATEIDRDKARREQGSVATQERKAFMYVAWKGKVIGLYPTGSTTWEARPIFQDAERLPRNRMLSLDVFQPAYDRRQVGKFKAAILAAFGG